jgi:hypothetical protein
MSRRGGSFFFFMMLVLAGVAGAQTSRAVSDSALLEELLMAIAARDRMQQEYLGLLSAGRLTHRERSDFSAYLEQLELSIAHQCSELAGSYPGPGEQQLPCLMQRAAGGLPARLANEQTAQEQLAELDASLASELAEFDEKLLVEQQQVRTRAARASESGGADGGQAGGEGSSKNGEGGGDAGPGAGGEDSGAEEAGRDRDARSGEASSTADGRGAGGDMKTERSAGGASAPPEDIPDGSDDDVVARQLREAAQKERDPELKRRLWDEYRRYKGSTR